MGTAVVDPETASMALALLEELVAYQRKKVREVACRIHPGLTDADIRNIRDFADVYRDPAFQFEEGQLAGLVSAQIALKARLVAVTLPRS
jgi:hypothetical protein